jgi:hypothetical protein
MWLRRGFFVAGLMLLWWAAVVVVIAALTTWWVLVALVPLGMMSMCLPMMGAMAASSGADPSAAPWTWCAAWFAPSDHEARKHATPSEGSTP